METTYQVLISLITIIAVMVAGWFAYDQGYLDPVIEKIGEYMFKAKAKAEEKKMEAEGLKRGEDFVDSQLTGNQQADDVKAGLGSFGSLKKDS
ncbi:hypothetical protein UCRPA7_5559 [Phaeoacremonium minimum UCRPA7]|uniref:Uncharacterized protein n=1 Tax=Phaeoacremonium minimum (strain UCR-PA7) TaxID=1286976 RepID=R8BHZ2_PHAM7|nr:hypothetical protein UCRPA7_5559 [Phaeoacremonium minimum UCRPA7]EON98960.1 hypothetical protein UCRPA7_5559 [Phaeoacremonium minimum UCRPA7]